MQSPNVPKRSRVELLQVPRTDRFAVQHEDMVEVVARLGRVVGRVGAGVHRLFRTVDKAADHRIQIIRAAQRRRSRIQLDSLHTAPIAASDRSRFTPRPVLPAELMH